MRKIIVVSMITLDGVMQAPGGPEEDTSGGFKYGGWVFPFFDEYGARALDEQLGHPFDLLLGRKTYDIWKQYWPQHKDGVIGAAFDSWMIIPGFLVPVLMTTHFVIFYRLAREGRTAGKGTYLGREPAGTVSLTLFIAIWPG